jgi:hypothetical protein
MANRILLKNIFIEKYYCVKEAENILPTISISENDNFWQSLEKEKIHIKPAILEKTNLACWYCGLFFDEKPSNIPIFLFKDTIKMQYDLSNNYVEPSDFKNLPHHALLDGFSRTENINVKYYGNFCTIFCALRFLTETIDIPHSCKEHYKNMIYMLYSEEIGREVRFIPLAHPKTLMNIYTERGISEQEYKNLNKNLLRLII